MKKLILLFAVIGALLCGCSQSLINTYGDEMMVLQQENIYTMFDGTEIDHYVMGMMEQEYYCLEKKGQPVEILMIEKPKGPEGVRNGELCFDDLNETAKAAIGAYFEEQGLLYDVAFEVENAYAEYVRRDNNHRLFNWHYISQTVWPTGATEKIIGFCTEMIYYRGEEEVRQEWNNVIFDRQTGEQIDIWELFCVSPEEVKALVVKELLPEEPAEGEEDLQTQMEQAFCGEYIKLFDDGIEVMFPAGTLECKEKAFGGFIEGEKLAGMMYDWAMATQ